MLGVWMLGACGVQTGTSALPEVDEGPVAPAHDTKPTPVPDGGTCHADAKPTPEPAGIRAVGSFRGLRATEDHTYGHGVELMADGTTCAGVYLFWDGNLEPHWSSLTGTCGSDGSVHFETTREWWLGFKDPGPFTKHVVFDGAVRAGVLEGTLTVDGEAEPVKLTAEDDAPSWERSSKLAAADVCVGPTARSR